MTVELCEVRPEDTASLRRQVLRNGLDRPPLGDEPDDDSLHLAAYDGDVLVGAGNVRPLPDGTWRIRGMAVAPSYRGRGVGAAVLAGLLTHVEGHGGGLVWCHARTAARSLYERAGFTAVGEEWLDPDIGPHVQMVRTS